MNLVDFLGNKKSSIQLIFQPRKWAEISWYSSQENELNSVDFLGKKRAELLPRKLIELSSFLWQENQLNSARFFGWNICLFQLIFVAGKWASLSVFSGQAKVWIFYVTKRAVYSWFYSHKNELKLVDIPAQKTSWL